VLQARACTRRAFTCTRTLSLRTHAAPRVSRRAPTTPDATRCAHARRTAQGKDKPSYDPSTNCGDVVVVVNAGDVALTGNKLRDKIYTRHTGYPGGLKTRTAAESLARDPTSLLRDAVLRMLPRNVLRAHRARKLRLFAGPEHPGFAASALTPLPLPPRRVRDKEELPADFALPPGVVPMNEPRWAASQEGRARGAALRDARQAAIDAAIAAGGGGAR
jgi:ribosomal protein L13